MRRSFAEQFILLIAAIGFLTCLSALYFYEGVTSEGQIKEVPLGLIHPEGSQVRVRHATMEGWKFINRSGTLYNEDRIFTGRESQARLTLQNQGSLTVNPNSLLVVRSKNNQMGLDLQKGGVLGFLQKNGQIAFYKNGVQTILKAHAGRNSFTIHSEDDHSLKIKVQEGQLKMSTVPIPVAQQKMEIENNNPTKEDQTLPGKTQEMIIQKDSEVTVEFPKEDLRKILAEGENEKDFLKSTPVITIQHVSEKSISPIQNEEQIIPQSRTLATVTALTQEKEIQKEVQLVPNPSPVAFGEEPRTPEAPLKVDSPNANTNSLNTNETILKTQFWIYLGLGAAISYTQEHLQDYSSGKATSIDTPQILLKAGTLMEGQKGLEFNYKETPGKIYHGQSDQKKMESYKWKILSLDYLQQANRPNLLLDWNDQLIWRFGFQAHEFYTMLPAVANSTDLKLETTGLFNASCGFEYSIFNKSKGRSEFIMRYQHPLLGMSQNSQDSFSVRPNFSFDGGIGHILKLENLPSVGIFWYGQYQSFSFNYKRSDTEFKGQQQFFNTAVDVRIGYEF